MVGTDDRMIHIDIECDFLSLMQIFVNGIKTSLTYYVKSSILDSVPFNAHRYFSSRIFKLIYLTFTCSSLCYKLYICSSLCYKSYIWAVLWITIYLKTNACDSSLKCMEICFITHIFKNQIVVIYHNCVSNHLWVIMSITSLVIE